MRKYVVVDSNVVLKWTIEEEDSATAMALLSRWNKDKTTMLAPALLVYEVTNILYQNVRKSKITLDRAREALTEVLETGLKLDFSQDVDLSRRALELAYRFNVPATYDPHYLALAERKGCELWTADTRMWRAVRDDFDWVHTIDDISIS